MGGNVGVSGTCWWVVVERDGESVMVGIGGVGGSFGVGSGGATSDRSMARNGKFGKYPPVWQDMETVWI